MHAQVNLVGSCVNAPLDPATDAPPPDAAGARVKRAIAGLPRVGCPPPRGTGAKAKAAQPAGA